MKLNTETIEAMKSAVRSSWLRERSVKCRYHIACQRVCTGKSAIWDVRQSSGGHAGNRLASYHALVTGDGHVVVEARG